MVQSHWFFCFKGQSLNLLYKNMEIQLQQPKKIVIKPAEPEESIELTQLKVKTVIDDAEGKRVLVFVEGIRDPILLSDLSGDNYDNPEWTNESLLRALENFS